MLTIPQLRRLVGNPSAYAIQRDDGGYVPVRQWVTNAVLRSHLAGQHTVGTYVINPSDKSRTLVIDVDTGELRDALDAKAALVDLGFRPNEVGVEPSGKKGFHVWVVVNQFIPAIQLRSVGLAALAVVGQNHEVFPKQTEARDLGSLVKLPGGVHRVTGKRTDFLDGFPAVVGPARLAQVVGGVPEISGGYGGPPPPSFPCMEAIQEGVGEGMRNHGLFHLAVMLRRGGLAPEHIANVVYAVNERCSPPLDPDEVEQLLESSVRSGPLCRTLEGTDLHCGDACILRRRPGLSTRAGHVRDAAPGEKVVVEIKSRDGRVLKVAHPDGEGEIRT